MSKRIVCVIPARLDSSRCPQKVIANLAGKPLVQWTWEAAKATGLFDEIVVAVDEVSTTAIVESFGGKAILTSKDCPNGTHRMIEVMKTENLHGDIWVNWQCDEPFIQKSMIEELLQTVSHDTAHIWTLKKKITTSQERDSSNTVKVVCDCAGNALYFSRHPIPFHRTDSSLSQDHLDYYKHIGIYAYTKQALKHIAHMPACALEEHEKLEQLRFLFYGLKIQVHETNTETLGIDTPIDLARAAKILAQNR